MCVRRKATVINCLSDFIKTKMIWWRCVWNEDRPLGSKQHQWVTLLGGDDDDERDYVTVWECVL